MSSNPPDPTEHEGHDDAVADVRNDVMEWLGNCQPVYASGVLLSQVSPLALGVFVTSCLVGLHEDSFTDVEMATARGEVAHTPRARRLMEGVLGDNEHVNLMTARLLPDIPAADRGARALLELGPGVDNNTAPYRDYMEQHIEWRLLRRVDWHKLASDMNDEPVPWQSYTKDHDGRGCFNCLGGYCLVGLEDA